MLAGYQSNTQQVKLFRTMSYQLIESLTDYDDEKENRKMHPLLMPSIDTPCCRSHYLGWIMPYLIKEFS